MEHLFDTSILGPVLSFIGAILVALISYRGVEETNDRANNNMQNEMRTQQALFNQKLDSLTKEVQSHNNFARRIPVVESEIEALDNRVRRLEDKIDSTIIN